MKMQNESPMIRRTVSLLLPIVVLLSASVAAA